MSPSNERSAEWLRGAVESHINTCNLITSITSATKSHPARQGLMAAGNELHNQLDRYRPLLAEAEAREASQPTAAEVIEAAEKALETAAAEIPDVFDQFGPGGYSDVRQVANPTSKLLDDATTLIARWKEAHNA